MHKVLDGDECSTKCACSYWCHHAAFTEGVGHPKEETSVRHVHANIFRAIFGEVATDGCEEKTYGCQGTALLHWRRVTKKSLCNQRKIWLTYSTRMVWEIVSIA